jgi:peptide/nickel transport system substrate-binding protein
MPLIDRRTKLKARRIIRRQKRTIDEVGEKADQDINRLFFRRFGRLEAVRRFVAVWTVLVLLLGLGALWQVRSLDKFYLSTMPVEGGVYREGIIGSFTNANPLFATTSVDTSVSRLIFSGLFKVSPSGEVVGDLASDIKVDEKGVTYTVTLRDDVYWHDGEKFDSEDVVFTYASIQNPDVKSPLRSSWTGVKVTSPDLNTVVFTLPNALSSFSYSLINGIIPAHILKTLEAEDLRSSLFNSSQAVGTGAFKLKTIEASGGSIDDRQERIALVRNEGFYGQKPGLDSVVIRSYRTEEKLLKDFEEQVIQSMVGLSSVPDYIVETPDVELQEASLTSTVTVFFKNSSEFLKDKKVRQALVQATNVAEIRKSFAYDVVSADSPFLKSQFAYNPEIVQLPYDIEQSKRLLDEAGWIVGADGIRTKDGIPLTLRFVSQSLSEYAAITQKLQQEWSNIGVKVDAILQPEEDIQGGTLSRHDYDVLLYGISIGYDPDVFAYWHSSQIDPNSSGLNLSEFDNATADEALEAGRTRLDEQLRKIKYEPFLKVWKEEAPAVALYQSKFLMVTRGTFDGFKGGQLNTATDRYWSIADWKVRNAQVVKP